MRVEDFENLSYTKKCQVLGCYEAYFWVKRAVLLVIVIGTLSLSGCPSYNVWKQGLGGKAELARARHNRQIAIEEALALKEASQHKADAEAIRATGVKKANETIAEGLGGPEGYLRYLYIDALQATSCKTIYVPTEAGLPILEAGNNN